MNQTTSTLLLVRPSHFGFNQQTAESNLFQKRGIENNVSVKASAEFDAFTRKMNSEKIQTLIFDDVPGNTTPDAVFPNNWISLHHDGTVVLYPMTAKNRRPERRRDIIESLSDSSGFFVKDIIDLSFYEQENLFLEGTGSLVFDHANKQVYMARSQRSSEKVIIKIEEKLGYHAIVFDTKDAGGHPVYHTNVMMSIGKQFAVIGTEFIMSKKSQEKVLESLDSTGRTIVELTPIQILSFAGNVLEVANQNGDPFILISETALSSLNKIQIQALEKCSTLLPVNVPTIEHYGGGSVRCMVAEVFLPKSPSPEKFTVRKPANEQELKAGFDLRWKILRKPWNQPKGSETDDLEATSVHFLAFNKRNDVVGTARLQLVSNETGQIRYMAVDQDFEGMGIGKMLVLEIEKEALKRGLKYIFLQAREPALPFYKSVGFSITEKTYLLFDAIQHYAMTKELK